MKWILRAVLFAAVILGSRIAVANPVLCSPGYQDSTCVTPISRAPTPAPQCSAGAGWTTTSSAVWQGAQWSSPGCNYQAPPTCPAGTIQASGPFWNGGSWSQPVCAAVPPPAPPSPPPPAGHVLVATITTNMCGTLGPVNKYADGIYEVLVDFPGGTVSGTWDSVFAAVPSHRNQKPWIPEPSDSAYAVSYLAQAYWIMNPWDCGGGVG